MCHPEVPAGVEPIEVRTAEVSIAVDARERMPALLALPERTPAPAVLVTNDVFGRSPFYENLSLRLAQAGYVALDAEFFFREGPLAEQTREAATARSQLLDQQRTVRDLGAAIDWLKARDEVRGEKIGTIGFCMGGTLTLDLAVRGDVAATVSYYGFPARGGDSPKAPPKPLDLAAHMRGRILGHWGDQDTGVGMENVEELRSRLAAAKVDHTIHIYPGLAHGFLKAFLDDERSPGYEQACTSWKRTLDFYREALSERRAGLTV